MHLLGKTFPQVARGAILESAAVPPTFPAARNEFAWKQFVAAVPQCASSANTSSTIECLRQSATSESLLQALKTAQPYINAGTFGPCLDGPGGLIPTYLSQVPPPSRIPMIIGSNLDEGKISSVHNTLRPWRYSVFQQEHSSPRTPTPMLKSGLASGTASPHPRGAIRLCKTGSTASSSSTPTIRRSAPPTEQATKHLA